MADEAVAEHPAEPAAPKAKDARSPEAPPRGDDNAKDAPDAPGSSDASDSADAEAAEREKERERAADRFKDRTRDPLAEEQGEEGPTDAAAATRARQSGQKLLASSRDLVSFDRSDVGQVHINNISVGLDARRSGLSMRDGPVPAEDLLRIRRTHIEPEGYVRLRRALEARRLLVLGGAPGTGRASTALALLEEVTRDGEGRQNSERVRRADPEGGVRGLATQVMGGKGGHPRGTGYLLEPALDRPGTLPPDGMDLDQLASALAEQGSYAVVVVSVGSAANPLLAGRYGAICPPAPTRELVAVRLRQRLEEEHGDPARGGGGGEGRARDGGRAPNRHADRDRGADQDGDRTRHADHGGDRTRDGGQDQDRGQDRRPGDDGSLSRLLERAAELREDTEVTEAVGLDDLRPAEAELFASLLAGHLLGSVGREELLSGCRGLAAVQAYEWFAGVDRALAAPPPGDGRAPVRSGTAALFHPVAFRIALAVLGGASHSAVSAAAHLLTWELSVQSDPDSTPARPLFCDDPESDLALSRARPADGAVDVAGAEVTGRLIFYRGPRCPPPCSPSSGTGTSPSAPRSSAGCGCSPTTPGPRCRCAPRWPPGSCPYGTSSTGTRSWSGRSPMPPRPAAGSSPPPRWTRPQGTPRTAGRCARWSRTGRGTAHRPCAGRPPWRWATAGRPTRWTTPWTRWPGSGSATTGSSWPWPR